MLIIHLKKTEKKRRQRQKEKNKKKVKRYEPREMNQNKQTKRMHKLMFQGKIEIQLQMLRRMNNKKSINNLKTMNQ